MEWREETGQKNDWFSFVVKLASNVAENFFGKL